MIFSLKRSLASLRKGSIGFAGWRAYRYLATCEIDDSNLHASLVVVLYSGKLIFRFFMCSVLCRVDA